MFFEGTFSPCLVSGTHVFWWTCWVGPQKTWGFWVHQKTWGFRRGKISETWVFWVHQKTWGFKRGRVHQKTWGFGVHQKTWGFRRGNKQWVHQSTWDQESIKRHEVFYTRVSDHCSMASTGGAGVKPLLGSANMVQCQVRLGLVRLGWVR